MFTGSDVVMDFEDHTEMEIDFPEEMEMEMLTTENPEIGMKHEVEIENLKKSNELYVKHIENLKIQLKRERSRFAKLKSRMKYRRSPKEIATEMLKPLLTKNQIDLLLGIKKKVHWTSDEISTAFSLAYMSRR